MAEQERHLFHIESVWTGDSDGDGALWGDWEPALEYGAPAALGGKPGRANPEELLLSAVVACYSISLAYLLERRRLPVTKIAIAAEGEVARQPDRILKYTTIRLAVKMTFPGGDETQKATCLEMAHRADRYCPISNALRGNVEVQITPEILEETP